jgi:hypothetical protein
MKILHTEKLHSPCSATYIIIVIKSGMMRWGGGTQTHRQDGRRISLLLFFFQNKESRLIKRVQDHHETEGRGQGPTKSCRAIDE